MWAVDRLVNLVSGLGTAKEKRTATLYAVQEMDEQLALAANRGDWIAGKVVTIAAH